MDNTNIQTTAQTSSANNTIHAEQKPKLTFLDRYLYLREPHNRVNRSTFFFNLIVFGLLLHFLPKSIVISIILTILILVQMIKRLHDFNASGSWAITIILYNIIIFFGPTLYFMSTGQAKTPLEADLLWTASIISLGPVFLFIMPIINLLPTLVLSLIPGNKEENRFGKPWKV